MSKVYDEIWEEFWPLRAVVRAYAGTGVDSGIGNPATIEAMKSAGVLLVGGESDELLESLYKPIETKWAEMRNHIIARYYYLVENTAEGMHMKVVEVEPDQLASMGVDGIYDAVDGYGVINPLTGKWDGIDPKKLEKKPMEIKPVKFETYAVYRIKGAVKDALRREDWVPRLVRSRARSLDEKTKVFVAEHGRKPTQAEAAKFMKMSLADYQKFVESSAVLMTQSLNMSFDSKNEHGSNQDEMSMMDVLNDPKTPEPLESMVQEELRSKLFGKNFTPLERRIIYAYYYEGRSMKEISEQVGLSESRVSQMNTSIIERLRDKINRNPEYFGKAVLELLKR
jgi:RNA polymerase sigma factor for flagellar operon FliA